MSFSRRSAFDLPPNRLAARRAELEAQGRTLVDLTETNPTHCGLAVVPPTLPEVLTYEPAPLGLPEARLAVAELLDAAVHPRQVVLSASTSEAYAWLFLLLCEAGDAVLVPRPTYPLLDALAQLAGVELQSVPLRLEDERWALDLPVLLEASTGKTRAVVLVSPNNPTGHLISEAELHAVAQVCAERGWALIVDEVFFDPQRHHPMVSGRALPCLTFGLGGLSKLAGLPQLKLAWTVVSGPPARVSPALERLEHLADTFLSVAAPVQQAAPELLRKSPAFRAAVAQRVAENHAQVKARVHPGAPWQPFSVAGGWSQVLRLPTIPGEEAVCEALLEAGVVAHPGYFYDFPHGAWLVLSLLPPPSRFAAAFDRVARLLNALT